MFGSTIAPIEIKIAERLVSGDYNYSTIESVLKHELCHWYLSINGKKFGDYDKTFLDEIERIGSTSTFTLEAGGNQYSVVCKKCGKVAGKTYNENKAKKWARDSRYSSRCCNSSLTLGETVYVEDRNSKYTKGIITSVETLNILAGDGKIEKVADVAKAPERNINTTILAAKKEVINENKETKEEVINEAKETKGEVVTENKEDKKEVITENKEDKKEVTNEDKEDKKTTRKTGRTQKMHNGIMIPLIKTAVDSDNKDEIQKLKEAHPEVFESSLKYIGNKRRTYISNL
jgi:predicted SprT family Zn-dependent metalloprotease